MGTPFVPPLPSPEGSPQPRRSTRGAGGAPSWAQQPPSGAPPAQSPYSGGYVNPYMGTPFVPPMSALASPAFVPGSYFAPPAALPGSPSGGVQLGSNGLPTDFVGFGMASAAMQSPYAAPGAIPGGPPGGHPPSMSAPQSPWNAPGTAFNAFQQPLSGGPPPGGPPPPAAAAPPPWAAAPPPPAPQWNQWNPSMIAALQAQAQVQAQAQAMAQAQAAMAAAAAAAAPPPPPVASARSRDWRDHLAEREPTDKVDPFSVGPHYGLVLTPFLVAVVKPDLQVNPFLKAGPDDDTEYLKWNMLWPSSYCSRSDDPPHKSWSRGRGEPMTFPRLTSLRIVSKTFPWMIEIKAADESIGVTCGDVIDSLDDYFHGMVKKEEFDSAPRQKKKDMTAAYHLNRSTAHGVPGGRLGEGIRRLDWLGKDTVFGGIDRNDALVAEQYGGLPATFELKCEMRYQMSEREIREQDELEGELERERENARSRASHHSHGGASRGGSISRTNSRANHRD